MKSYFLLLALLLYAAMLDAQSAALHRGQRQYQQRNYAEAENSFRKAENATGRYNAGNAAYQQEKYEEAAADFLGAAAADTSRSGKADALFNLGNAYLRQGKYPEAIEAYRKSLRLSPNRADARKNMRIAQKLMDNDNPPPPPPPPPDAPPPQDYYVDQARSPRKKETYDGPLTPEAAESLLETEVVPEEEENAREFREQTPARQSTGRKKDW